MTVVVFTAGILGFVVIPKMLGKFKAASAMDGNSLSSVSGNGGAAVMVGEYLYFTAGFTSKNDYVYKQNEYNKVREYGQGGIWRVRMADGKPNYDNNYLRDYLKKYEFLNWENGFEQSTVGQAENPDAPFNNAVNKNIVSGKNDRDRLELIVPKIAGWEDTAIWIFGDNLIYTSPNNQKDRHGDLQTERIDFFHCDLRGQKHKKIYTTKTDGILAGDYTVIWGGAPYLVVLDGSSLVRVNMKGKANTIADGVFDAILPVITDYNIHALYEMASLENSYSGIMGHVFYTQDEGASVSNYNVGGGYGNNVVTKSKNKHSLIAFGNGRLMIQTNFADGTVPSSKLYLCTDPNLADRNDTNRVPKLQPSEGSTVYLSGERSEPFRYITHDGSAFRVYDEKGENVLSTTDKKIPTGEIKGVIAMNPNNIIFKDENGVTTIHYQSGEKIGTISAEKMSGAVEGARVTAFRILDKNGYVNTNGGYMVFFVKTVTEEQDRDEYGEITDRRTSEDMEKRTVGTIITADRGLNGREYVLASLDPNKYVAFPSLPPKPEN